YAVHPIADRAVGVVVERIHAVVLKAAIRFDAVPALPDRCRALFDGVEPGWIRLLQKQRVGGVQMPVLGEHVTEVGRAEETRGEMISEPLHVSREPICGIGTVLLAKEVEPKRQRVRGLCRLADTARGGDELVEIGRASRRERGESPVPVGAILSERSPRSTRCSRMWLVRREDQ